MISSAVDTVAAVFEGVERPIDVRPLAVRRPGPTEVLVRVTASGVCHTDHHVVAGGLAVSLPLVLGHEAAGVVELVGESVRGLAPGDTVVVLSGPPCGTCWFCLRGEGNSCERMDLVRGEARFVDRTGVPMAGYAGLGTFSERVTLDETAVVAVATSLPPEQLALVSCAVVTGVGAALTAPVRPGDAVVVVGCGGVGLAALQGARVAGARSTIAVDPVPAKRAIASCLGATHTVDPAELDVAEFVRAHTEGRGADISFEAVGSAGAAASAIRSTRRGGTSVLLGLPSSAAMLEVPLAELVNGRKRVIGSIYGGGDPRRLIPTIVQLAEAGRLDLAALVTQTIALDDVVAALTVPDRDSVRAVIRFAS